MLSERRGRQGPRQTGGRVKEEMTATDREEVSKNTMSHLCSHRYEFEREKQNFILKGT